MSKSYVKSYKLVEPNEDDLKKNPYIRFKDAYEVIIEIRYFFGFYTEEITKRVILKKGFNMKKYKPGTRIDNLN